MVSHSGSSRERHRVRWTVTLGAGSIGDAVSQSGIEKAYPQMTQMYADGGRFHLRIVGLEYRRRMENRWTAFICVHLRHLRIRSLGTNASRQCSFAPSPKSDLTHPPMDAAIQLRDEPMRHPGTQRLSFP
jgi:hypothetical protein